MLETFGIPVKGYHEQDSLPALLRSATPVLLACPDLINYFGGKRSLSILNAIHENECTVQALEKIVYGGHVSSNIVNVHLAAIDRRLKRERCPYQIQKRGTAPRFYRLVKANGNIPR